MEALVDNARFEAVLAENRALQAKLMQLEHELGQLKRLIFGTKSERFVPSGPPEQLPLFAGASAETMTGEAVAPPVSEGAPVGRAVTYTRAPRKAPVRQVLPAHLPREVIQVEPEIDTTGLKKIGEEVTETLDYRPGKLVVIRRVRPKYVDPRDESRGVVIAALPARPIEKGLAEPALLAHVVVEKYVDHLPLYRQVQRFTRTGITLAEATLGDWIAATAELLEPLYTVLGQQARQSGYLQADETPIAVLASDKPGATHQGYYWVYHAPEAGLVVLDYQRSRGRDGPTAFLAGYQGALQSDGYAVYDGYDAHPGITTYNCWAHARRYFHEALPSSPEQAAHVLSEIGQLYSLERLLREHEAEAAVRRAQRQAEAVPVLSRLKVYLEAHPGLPKSPWGQAVGYVLGRWQKLCRYTEDGRIEIDNNLVENVIRPIALGRKNYLFAGSHAGAERAAVLYSLLGTCKQHGVNPESWLADVLGGLPTHPMKQVQELLPHHWKNSKV